jgi:hypothetical protein
MKQPVIYTSTITSSKYVLSLHYATYKTRNQHNRVSNAFFNQTVACRLAYQEYETARNSLSTIAVRKLFRPRRKFNISLTTRYDR